VKLIITLASLLYFSPSFSHWTRVQQLPSSDIFSLYHKEDVLYAGGKNKIYISKDNGQTWDSTNVIPQFFEVDNIIVYKNEFYAACFSIGVFRSSDSGSTWQNISAGIAPFVSDFCEFKENLYASTLGNSIFKLNSVNGNNWLSFSNGLSNQSANNTSIAGNNNALVAGTLANAMYDYLPDNSTTWEERFLLGQISPTEGVQDIVTAHDSLFLSGSSGKFYLSTDNGLNWTRFGNNSPSQLTLLVNAKQAFLAARNIFNGQSENTLFAYAKKDSLGEPFVVFSFVPNHFTYKTEISGNKLWDASSNGLFYMSLSDLPGISSAEDFQNILLPGRFISFDAKCEGNKLLLTWKTAQEQNSSHFNIEKSEDGIRWTSIGNLPAAGNSAIEKNYSFNVNQPLQNNFYRIAEYDLNGRVQYTNVLRASCNVTDVFNLWPNPSHDIVFVNIVSANESQGMIKVFDSKGALVKVQKATVSQGSNLISVDMKSIPKGVYSLAVYWDNGQSKKTIKLIRQ
jgi:hypothetical protein